MKKLLSSRILNMALLVCASVAAARGDASADTSSVATAGSYNTNGAPTNFRFAGNTGIVQATFSVSGCQNCTGYLGFSNGNVTDYDFAAEVNINNNGNIRAVGGTATVPFAPGTTYAFRLVMDTSAGTYSAYVTPAGTSEQTLGTGIRLNKPGVADISDFAFIMWNGFTLSNVQLDTSPTTSPPASCTFDGRTVASGDSITAFQSASVPPGQSCTSQTRTCSNGALSASYAFSSCTNAHATTTPLTLPPTVIYGNHYHDPLAVAGYLDVTLYGADPSGSSDSTRATHRARMRAEKLHMVTLHHPPDRGH